VPRSAREQNSAKPFQVLQIGRQQQLLQVPLLAEGMLREEQIPPSCCLPDLPQACDWNQHTSSPGVSFRGSCGHSPDEGNRAQLLQVVEDSCCKSTSVRLVGTSGSHSGAQLSSAAVMQCTDTRSLPTASTNVESPILQQSISLSGTSTGLCTQEAEGEPVLATVMGGVGEASLMTFQPQSANPCARKSGQTVDSSLAERHPGQRTDRSGSEATCVKRQRVDAPGARSGGSERQ
jgi:hypothetical protein